MPYPKLYIERMQSLLGDGFGPFCESLDKEPFHSLRINTLRRDKKAVTDAIGRLVTQNTRPVPWAADGLYYPAESRPGKSILHEAGYYYIQEPSAMSVVSFLSPSPGEKILDLCASPGGKSTQIASAMKDEGLLISNEIHPARAKILSENIERMGVSNCVVTNEAPDRLAMRFPLFFDRILTDAPCSGEGMLRKNDEAFLEWSPENVIMCAERQKDILNSADLMLKYGGRLVYSTCTFSTEENEQVILDFLKEHPGYTIEKLMHEHGMLPGLTGGPASEGMVRLFPHLLNGEGHFIAVMKKGGETAPEKEVKGGSAAKKKKSGDANLATVSEFFTKMLRSEPSPNGIVYNRLKAIAEGKCPAKLLFYMGENLYLLPEALPEPGGLKLIRPGLQLGCIKNSRFEPSMSLARALTVDDINYYVNLDLHNTDDRNTLKSYFEGNTFNCETSGGWNLIAADGVGVGWGKASGSVMKNHYPKGLRKSCIV